MKGLRKLVIDGQEWHWQFKNSRIIIFDSMSRKNVFFMTDFTGWNWSAVEESTDNHSLAIRPKDVVSFIRNDMKRTEPVEPWWRGENKLSKK